MGSDDKDEELTSDEQARTDPASAQPKEPAVGAVGSGERPTVELSPRQLFVGVPWDARHDDSSFYRESTVRMSPDPVVVQTEWPAERPGEGFHEEATVRIAAGAVGLAGDHGLDIALPSQDTLPPMPAKNVAGAVDEAENDEATREFRGLDNDTTQPDAPGLARDVGGPTIAGMDSTEHVLPMLDRWERELRERIDRGAPARELPSERTRRRISALVEHAQQLADRGEHQRAVLSLELAFAEDPDSATAHKILRVHESTICGVFAGYLGDPAAAPQLGMDASQIIYERLDAHAAFLLSRVDGALSLEELIDIAGMTRVDALRYLSSLLLRDILILPR